MLGARSSGMAHVASRLAFTALSACVLLTPLPAPLLAEPSLANLLKPAAPRREPADALADQLLALERRAYAHELVVQNALLRVRAELQALRSALATGAEPAVLERRISLVWAALSWADRVQANVQTQAAIAGLAARAEQAEAELARERAALEAARAWPDADDLLTEGRAVKP